MVRGADTAIKDMDYHDASTQIDKVTDELSLSISEPLYGSITTDSVSIRSALRGHPTGFFLTGRIDEPGAFSIPGIGHHVTSDDERESEENHNSTFVQHAILCAEGRIVEPINFAEINVPNFTIKKVMIPVLTLTLSLNQSIEYCSLALLGGLFIACIGILM